MKEKRIVALFIVAAVTLVASLAITFGVRGTLADPVVATGVTRYEYSFGAANNSLISTDGNTLSMKNDIVFQPSSSLIWSEKAGEEAIWFNGLSYEDEIVYADESISAKLKVIPIRISNNYSVPISTTLKVSYKDSILAKYTFVKLYNYADGSYRDITGSTATIQLAAETKADYAIVVFADQSTNTSIYQQINFGTDFQKIDVSVTNNTAI